MQPIWGLVLVAFAFIVILHLRKRRRRKPEPKVYSRRVSGSQVVASLHPEISRACLLDHGTQFGKGFRRKEGPQLPHDDHCRCRSMPFSFTSNEVFQGALRRDLSIETTIADFPAEQALRLIERLRDISADTLPASAALYVQSVDMEDIDKKHHSDVESFLQQRYDFLMAQEGLPDAPERAEGE